MTAVGDGAPVLRARDELVRGLGRMLGTKIETQAPVPATRTLLIGTLTDLRRAAPALRLNGTLAEDAFRITSVTSGSVAHLVIAGGARGVLYGAFALLRRVSAGTPLEPGDWTEAPYAPLRWIDHWDNIDGSIERGYGGRSIFWDAGHVREDLSRVDDYGRLLASLGINGIALSGRIDQERFDAVLSQLEYQSGEAVVWRDAVSRWFLRASDIADGRGRVGHYPGRVEAESRQPGGYVAVAVTPWEAASGEGAVECRAETCTAGFIYAGAPGIHDLVVAYYDVNTGAARYRVRAAGKVVGEWTAAGRLPTQKLDGTSATRRMLRGVQFRQGDRIEIEGTPDGSETAALDYVEVTLTDSSSAQRSLNSASTTPRTPTELAR